MVIGAFVDKTHRPTDEEILELIGPKSELWSDLVGFMNDHYDSRKDFAFYGKNYGWVARFRKGNRRFFPFTLNTVASLFR